MEPIGPSPMPIRDPPAPWKLVGRQRTISSEGAGVEEAGMSLGLTSERTSEMIQCFGIFMRMVGRDEKGAAAIEYGLLAALIAVAFFAGAQLLGTSLQGLFDDIATFLASVSPIGGGGTP